jgi:hypothetical protein
MGQDGGRHALIWVSGLSEAIVDQSVRGIARRLAIELSRHHSTAHFNLDGHMREETVVDPLKVEVCTIVRTDGDGEEPFIDLYWLPTENALLSDYDRRGPPVKALLTVLTLIRSVHRAVKARRSSHLRSKRWKERLQVFYAEMVMMLLFLYATVLVFAVVTTLDPAVSDALRRISQGTLVGLTLAGIWKTDAVRQLSRAATEMFCVMQYLDLGYRSDVLRGHLTDLVQHVHEHEQINYTTIDLMAYSFGTITAIDTLYPVDAEQTLPPVRTFVTIGCPFDLISTYWPSYFSNRYVIGGGPDHWLNIYNCVDVLGSNFRDNSDNDKAIGSRDKMSARCTTLRPSRSESYGREEELSSWQALLLMGLRVHGMYWEREFENETTVFSIVAPAVYLDDEA